MNIQMNAAKTLLLIVAVVGLVYQCTADKPQTDDGGDDTVATAPVEQPVSQPYADNTSLIVAARREIKNTLKDPDSVKFSYERTNQTAKYGEVACGAFNAKNSFGVYAGNVRYISSGKTTFIEGSDDTTIPFPEMWVEACL